MGKLKRSKEPLDPVVDRVRAARHELAKECGFDFDTIIRRLQEFEKACGAKFVSPPTRRIPLGSLRIGRQGPPRSDGPIVAEVRKARRKLLAESGNAPEVLVAKLRKNEAASGRRPVSPHKKKTCTA